MALVCAVPSDTTESVKKHDDTYHGLTHGSSHGQGHVGEGSQTLCELEQDVDVVLGPLARVLLQALPDSVSHRQALQQGRKAVKIRMEYV